MNTEKPLAGSVLQDADATDSKGLRPKSRPGHERRLERKIFAARLAVLFEQAAPRLWLLTGIAGLFVAISLAGLWIVLDPLTHKIILGLFLIALLVALALLARLRWPRREDVLRRMERISNIKHRPASSYEDSATISDNNPSSRILWKTHRKRLTQTIDKLRVGSPAPRTDKHDPLALRALLLLGVIVLTAIAGDSAADRMKSAFIFSAQNLSAEARLDAWVTPPAYTVKPPIMLSDGSIPTLVKPAQQTAQIELPQNSELVVRLSGTDLAGFALEVTAGSASGPQRIDAESIKRAKEAAAKDDGDSPADTQDFLPEDAGELRYIIKSSSSIRVLSGRTEIAHFRFAVIPDKVPTISLLKTPVRTHRGQLKLQYKIDDDYGVANAQARVELLPSPTANPAKAWARRLARSGKRVSTAKTPVLPLNISRDSRKKGKAKSAHELAKHAWSSRKVRLTLTVTDHAGQIGKSKSVDMLMPERWFRNPLARAIAEQRRELLWDQRNRKDVIYALEALSADPEEFFTNTGAYLGLRSAYHRLRQPSTPEKIKSVAEQLWQVAIRIEDGNLTDAQRRLRDAQDKLSKLLKENASPEEISKAMKELRQALAAYMKQLAEQAPNQKNNPNGTGKNQYITSRDFEKMMRDLEKMARSGDRNSAQQMLSEMRDLLDRLQSGRQANNRSNKQQQQMMKMMDEFGDLINKQQKLLDDTFRQQQQGQRNGRNGQEGERKQAQPGQQGRQGQKEGRQSQNNGKSGKGRQGKKGQGQSGTELSNRQGRLREMLDRLGRQMEQFGLKQPGEFGKAGDSMSKSKRALRRGRLGEGVQRERQALDQLRKGAQSMAEQMLSRMARRYGQRGRQRQSLDPLGRPRGGSSSGNGTEFSSRVQIPDKFRAQRSREILKELRRRFGESRRPKIELDYIERLLRQF